MMLKILYCLVGVVGFNLATAKSIDVQPLPLVPINDTQSIDALMDVVCAHPQSDCQHSKPVIYTAKNADLASTVFYAVHEENLTIQKIEQLKNKSWVVVDFWNLKASANHQSVKSPDVTVSIDPTLYPISKEEWAIALISSRSEMYSGGGGHFTSADFIALRPQQALKVLSNIPLSCSKLMRACFTAKDYKNSKRCHDEIDGDMIIKIKDTKKTNFFWQFTWLQTELYSKTPKSKMVRKNHSFTTNPLENLMPQGLKKIDFCGVSR
jgi:hypothetical protein